MKLFLDTNILIDVVAGREPWCEDALILLELATQKKVSLIAADYSFLNIVYIARKLFPKDVLLGTLKDLRQFVDIAEVGQQAIDEALSSGWNDFEDNIQAIVAEREKVDYIITRNEKDFHQSKIPAYSPRMFLDSFL